MGNRKVGRTDEATIVKAWYESRSIEELATKLNVNARRAERYLEALSMKNPAVARREIENADKYPYELALYRAYHTYVTVRDLRTEPVLFQHGVAHSQYSWDFLRDDAAVKYTLMEFARRLWLGRTPLNPPRRSAPPWIPSEIKLAKLIELSPRGTPPPTAHDLRRKTNIRFAIINRYIERTRLFRSYVYRGLIDFNAGGLIVDSPEHKRWYNRDRRRPLGSLPSRFKRQQTHKDRIFNLTWGSLPSEAQAIINRDSPTAHPHPKEYHTHPTFIVFPKMPPFQALMPEGEHLFYGSDNDDQVVDDAGPDNVS